MADDHEARPGADAERSFIVRRGDLRVLRELAAWTHEVSSHRGWSSSLRSDIDLALHEAVSNVIRHGIADEAEHVVTVSVAPESAGAWVRVSDDATPFDPLTAPAVPQAATLLDAQPGGRGLVLLRAMTTAMDYTYAGGRNVLTLHFPSRALDA